jgi:hypothetical protein
MSLFSLNNVHFGFQKIDVTPMKKFIWITVLRIWVIGV